MRLPDIWTGLVIAVLGGFVAAHAQTFPVPAGAASPRLFPEILGGALLLGGLLVAGRALAAGRGAGWAAMLPRVENWMRDPRRVTAILFIPVAIVAYSLVAPAIGSLPVAVAIMAIFALLSGGRPLASALIALIVSAAVIAFFVQIMGVPLPLGPLGGWL